MAKSLIVIFLCQHETLQTTLLHLPNAQKSLFSFLIEISSRYEMKVKLSGNKLKLK